MIVNKQGPVVIIEDDIDEQEIMSRAYKQIGCSNQLKLFSDGYGALEFLCKTPEDPFFIISDINMPIMNGFELRKKILLNEELKKKNTPFIFFSSAFDDRTLKLAVTLPSQGYFVKPFSIMELQKILTVIINYWKNCWLAI